MGLFSLAGIFRSVCLWLLILVALAAPVTPVVHGEDLDERVRQIASQLQCPVCQSVSVADSPSELARQMRGVIRQKLEQGETPEQIIQYFIDRYGEGVLLNPPKRGFALGAWLAPLAILLAGGWVVASFVRARTRRAGPQEALDEETASADLERYREVIRRELGERPGELAG
ncbi:MAG: cytochrome C biogenesis protein CcmH [Chloroflexota bacterium]